MRRQLARRHDAHLRANSLLAEHRAIFDASPGGRKVRASLAANVAKVTRLFIGQSGAVEDRRASTAQAQQARLRIREIAKAIVAVGKLVELPDADMSIMRLPDWLNDTELIAYAGALLER